MTLRFLCITKSFMNRLLVPALALSLSSLAAAQQTATFETASIKRAPADETRRGARGGPGGRLEYYNMTLRMLVTIAYDGDALPTQGQFVGGPKWIDEDRFNIVAKAEGDPGFDVNREPTRYKAMLQSLLGERFKLRVHRETRTADTFSLVLVDKEGKLGPQLTPYTSECYSAPPPPGTPLDPARRCGLGGPPGDIRGNGVLMSQLVTGFSRSAYIGRVVVDRTGLAGRYNLRLSWTPDADGGPSVFTVIEEQLGLKLQSAKAPIAYLVVDSAEKPTED